ncbi:hypothetical protein CsSME_00024099 [Camellia sinensis var. sinensis]
MTSARLGHLRSIFRICRTLSNEEEIALIPSENAAREEAWAKVSALEFEINAAMRDLDFERRRLKAARERIMLRQCRRHWKMRKTMITRQLILTSTSILIVET